MLTAVALAAAAFTTATVGGDAHAAAWRGGGNTGKTLAPVALNGGSGLGRTRIGGNGRGEKEVVAGEGNGLGRTRIVANPGAGGLPGVQGVKVMPSPTGGGNRVVGVKINPPVLPRPGDIDRDRDRDRDHDRINFGRIVQFDRFVSDYDERCHYVRKFWHIVKVCPDIY
jgi:hypothetical protein